jgi:hypothetical protein
MSQDIRRQLIRRNLGIRPISHGQIHTCQIALPKSEKLEISLERRQVIENSLVEHQSNLIPLIVRRTESHDEEDIEYEVVCGAEWFQIAQELGIEMLWTWVFDMTDEQAIAAKEEMMQLMVPTVSQSVEKTSIDVEKTSIDVESLIDRKLQLAADSIKQTLNASLNNFRDSFDEKLRNINYKFSELTEGLSVVPELPKQIEALCQKLELISQRSGVKKIPQFEGPQINLRSAQEHEIEEALKTVGTQIKQVDAALAAINYWKQPGKDLTWSNLERSAKASKEAEYKVKDFAAGTFKKLTIIGELP